MAAVHRWCQWWVKSVGEFNYVNFHVFEHLLYVSGPSMVQLGLFLCGMWASNIK